MNQLDVITGQYNRTILELQTPIVQAALELFAAQEKIAELEGAAKKDGEPKPHLEAVPKGVVAKEV